MKRLLVIFAVLFVLVVLADSTQAGTLDRGVHIGPFFIAGGANGDPTISQLKYQMAIDTWIGFKKRYTTITYNYNDNRGSTFNTYDVDIDSHASGSSAEVTITNTYPTG